MCMRHNMGGFTMLATPGQALLGNRVAHIIMGELKHLLGHLCILAALCGHYNMIDLAVNQFFHCYLISTLGQKESHIQGVRQSK